MHQKIKKYKEPKTHYEFKSYRNHPVEYYLSKKEGHDIPPHKHHFWMPIKNIPIKGSQEHIIVLWGYQPYYAFLDKIAGQYALVIDEEHYRYLWPTYNYEELTHYMPVPLAFKYKLEEE